MSAATMVLGLTTSVLAQEGPRQTGPDFGKASPFGLIVVVVLLICTFLLVWSMNKQLKKLPEAKGETFGERVMAFQKAHQLPGDGKAMPLTFVLVNRLTNQDEPRLR